MTGCQKSDLANFLAISEDFPVKIFMWSKIFWALPFIWCPVGGLVGDCGVRAVPRKTPIYFIFDTLEFQDDILNRFRYPK